MNRYQYYELPEFAAILSFIDSIFSEINIGLFIYHHEDPDDDSSLKLIYANKESARLTGANTQSLIGRYITDAFPSLKDTDIPATYAEVVRSKKPARVGVVRYEDENIEASEYQVRAFPMPSDCVGIIFERVEPSVASTGGDSTP